MGEVLSTQSPTAQAKVALPSMQDTQSMLSFDQHVVTLPIVQGKTYATGTELQLHSYTALSKPRETNDGASVVQRHFYSISQPHSSLINGQKSEICTNLNIQSVSF